MMMTSKPKLVTSAEVVASIDDLLIQIYIYLPAKSLMRFKSVSKRWKSLVTSPQFRLLRNPNLGLFFPLRKEFKFEYIHYNPRAPLNLSFHDPMYPNLDFWVTQSCNGLLLICCGTRWYMDKNPIFCVRRCYIYNPTTKQSRKITLPCSDDTLEPVHGVYMAFDPFKSPSCKIICVCCVDVIHWRTAEILSYSFESDSWSVCGQPFYHSANFSCAVYWNNAIHWISYATGEVLYFDVDQETLGWVPPPSNGKVDYFGVSCGDLHLVESNHSEGKIIVFEMNEDYSGWFVKHRVDLSVASRLYPWIAYLDFQQHMRLYKFCVYCFVGGGLVEGQFLVLQMCGKVLRFSIGSGTIEELRDFAGVGIGGWYTRYGGPMAFEYIKSLDFI